MTEYEYRVLSRTVGSDSGWFVVCTKRGVDRRYRTLSAARGQVTRELKELSRRARVSRHAPVREFKIQSRPVSVDWEDVE